MKKTIFLVFGLTLALSSCISDKEFLKENPKTIYTKDNAFEKAEQIDATLVTAYNKFNQINSYAIPLWEDGTGNFLHGDGSDVIGGARGAGDIGGFCNYWALQSNNGNFNMTWTSLYQLASFANLALDGLEIIADIDPEKAAYFEAQARFFRGWSYLRLAELFGGVPIVDKFSDALKFDYDRETRENTYTFAINDLKFAAENLPEYPAQSGRAAKGIAKHFLCEAYLGRGIETGNSADYTEAIKAADEVIAKHPLMTQRFGSRSENGTQPAGIPDNGFPRVINENYKLNGEVATPYFDLFVIGNYAYSDGNTESLMIYEQPMYDKVSVYGGSVLQLPVIIGCIYRDLQWNDALAAEHRALGTAGTPWGGKIDMAKYPGGAGGLQFTCSWGLNASLDYSDEYVWRGEFASDDRNSQIVRWDAPCINMDSPYYGQVVTKDMVADPAKLSRMSCKITTWDLWGWNLSQSFSMGAPFCNQYGRDWYIARSAETYLLRAEARLRKGDADGAAADINAVRSRAHATKLYTAAELQGDNGLYAILDERARELAWEELRWPTLLRMGGNGKNEIMHHQLENFSQGTFDVPAYAGQKFPEWTLFPIPFDVLSLNSELDMAQNPGWK